MAYFGTSTRGELADARNAKSAGWSNSLLPVAFDSACTSVLKVRLCIILWVHRDFNAGEAVMQRLDHRKHKVRELINEYRSGEIVIPEFQREYVWKPLKAARLLDSLYNGFPISSLLIWESSGQVSRRSIRPRITRSTGGVTAWLIDGQQRVITLCRIESGDEGIDVVFNSKTEEFRQANAATKKDPNFERVADLWTDDTFRRMRRGLGDDPESRKTEERFERVRRILDYEVPAVHMIEHSIENAVQAFQRINTLGVKLRKADIESAQVAAQHSGFIRDKVVPTIGRLRRGGFTRLHVTHLFRACAVVADPDGRKRTPLHALTSTEVKKAWTKTIKGLEATQNIMRSELGLVNMNILWSGALLVPAIVLCATHQGRTRKSKEIAGWMALAALHHRFSRSVGSTLDQDLRACRNPDPIGALLGNLRQKRRLRATVGDFQGTLADKSLLFSMYLACKQRGGFDFYTGETILLQGQIERHHLFPRSNYSRSERHKADVLANITFISTGTNKEIGNHPPAVYLKKCKKKHLKSQCIPIDPNLWEEHRARKFWGERRRLLAEAFNEFVSSCLPNRQLG